jgi:hypothetical protein
MALSPSAVLLAVSLAAPVARDRSPPQDAAAPGGEGRVVEEVVAVVRSPPSAPPRVVTRTKLVEEARIALVSRGATGAATGALDRAALRAALEWLLDQMLVSDEAVKLRLDDESREEVLAELGRFQARFDDPSAYRRFLEAAELSEDELTATLARMIRVQRYVQSRVGRTARISDDDADRWLRERGAVDPPPSAREAARAQLAEERAAAQVRELLSELRSRAEIRILGSLRNAEGA